MYRVSLEADSRACARRSRERQKCDTRVDRIEQNSSSGEAVLVEDGGRAGLVELVEWALQGYTD